MAGPQPIKSRISGDLDLGHDLTFAVRTACLRDAGNTLEHQHRRQRQLGVARTEQFAAAAGEEFLERIILLFLKHQAPLQ